MTAGDMWRPILSWLGTTWSSDASPGSPHFVKMEVTNRERGGSGGRETETETELFLLKVSKVLFNKHEERTRLLSDFFFFSPSLEKRLISRV